MVSHIILCMAAVTAVVGEELFSEIAEAAATRSELPEKDWKHYLLWYRDPVPYYLARRLDRVSATDPSGKLSFLQEDSAVKAAAAPAKQPVEDFERTSSALVLTSELLIGAELLSLSLDDQKSGAVAMGIVFLVVAVLSALPTFYKLPYLRANRSVLALPLALTITAAITMMNRKGTILEKYAPGTACVTTCIVLDGGTFEHLMLKCAMRLGGTVIGGIVSLTVAAVFMPSSASAASTLTAVAALTLLTSKAQKRYPGFAYGFLVAGITICLALYGYYQGGWGVAVGRVVSVVSGVIAGFVAAMAIPVLSLDFKLAFSYETFLENTSQLFKKDLMLLDYALVYSEQLALRGKEGACSPEARASYMQHVANFFQQSSPSHHVHRRWSHASHEDEGLHSKCLELDKEVAALQSSNRTHWAEMNNMRYIFLLSPLPPKMAMLTERLQRIYAQATSLVTAAHLHEVFWTEFKEELGKVRRGLHALPVTVEKIFEGKLHGWVDGTHQHDGEDEARALIMLLEDYLTMIEGCFDSLYSAKDRFLSVKARWHLSSTELWRFGSFIHSLDMVLRDLVDYAKLLFDCFCPEEVATRGAPSGGCSIIGIATALGISSPSLAPIAEQSEDKEPLDENDAGAESKEGSDSEKTDDNDIFQVISRLEERLDNIKELLTSEDERAYKEYKASSPEHHTLSRKTFTTLALEAEGSK
eukprot:gb/GFBE01021860.1/.p1 GENE.gb/GFBE01021860.1/~~gb/GFBE01021860.1/.p1  ORF type:complete len:701 (+),score=169.20 gb/GFBE01021860.1/:1-2103(+)